MRHRGPDDEGYLLWSPGSRPRMYAGAETAKASRRAHGLEHLPEEAEWRVAFGHRRLSIVDLSPGGHQPMVHAATGVSLAFNGEIFNHRELRRELESLGHRLTTHSDTEVLLVSWVEWGPECLNRFNGMFSFVVLDPRDGGTLHAVRDRFGIKPMHWARVGGMVGFSSEIKQLRSLPGFSGKLDHEVLQSYLLTGGVDSGSRTLHDGVFRLLGGERAVVRLDDPECRVEVTRWYDPKIEEWTGSDRDAAHAFRELLTDGVRYRLEADVPVGSCLSGGLDSSTIVCLARKLLEEGGEHAGQITVTACFDGESIDEWPYAEQVVRQTNATPVRVWPSAERLRAELSTQLWFMDEPYDTTSQFSQWCVFRAAAGAGLKVMLDGQGSDECLGGYSGTTDVALVEGLLRRGRVAAAVREARALARKRASGRWMEMALALRNMVPVAERVYRAAKGRPVAPPWLRIDAPGAYPAFRARNLGESLQDQIVRTSLPSLLRFEDRNSMAWSVEARVPFLDHRVVEFTRGLPDDLKIRNGLKKYVLREGMRGVIPEGIRQRTDKLGFATPERAWLRDSGGAWTRRNVEAALDVASAYVDADRIRKFVDDTVSGDRPHSSIPWRVLSFGMWLNVVAEGARAATSLVETSPSFPCL